MSNASRLGLALCLAFVVGACSSDEENGDARPLGEPELSIRSLGGVTEPSGTVEVELDCDAKLPLTVSVTNFALRPPDACFRYPQCGQIAVLIDPVLVDGGVVDAAATQLSATTFTDIDFAVLDEPEGEHLLRIELREDGMETAALGEGGKPLASELRVNATLASDCDAGADGSEADEEDASSASDADAS